jgi:hypothetical protein
MQARTSDVRLPLGKPAALMLPPALRRAARLVHA